mgnify:CR=1 FL=1
MTTDPAGNSIDTAVVAVAERARAAANELALATRAQKDAALLAMAEALVKATPEVLAANAEDVSAAEAAGTPAAIIDRLRLDESRVAAMADGLRDVAGLPDPVKSEIVAAWIVARPGETVDPETIRLHCRQSLAPYKVPSRIEVRDGIGFPAKRHPTVLHLAAAALRPTSYAVDQARRKWTSSLPIRPRRSGSPAAATPARTTTCSAGWRRRRSRSPSWRAAPMRWRRRPAPRARTCTWRRSPRRRCPWRGPARRRPPGRPASCGRTPCRGPCGSHRGP